MTTNPESLQAILNKQTQMQRRHYVPGTSHREDNSAHSLSVAMICWHYLHSINNDLSESKVLKYALIHDLVEIYAGDVNTYADDIARQQKVIDEARALKTLAVELSSSEDIVEHLQDYQNQADPESAFVWTCDKIQAYTQGSLDSWRAYKEYPVSKQIFIQKLDQQTDRVPSILKPEFQRLAKGWILSYPED